MAYLVMLINHLDVRILIGFVFLHKQKGKLIQVSARNQHTLAKEKFLCQGLESEEEAETGWKPRKGTHVYHESGGTCCTRLPESGGKDGEIGCKNGTRREEKPKGCFS